MKRANARDLLTGIGSRLMGARWTPMGAFTAVYLSREYQTAAEEYHAGYRQGSIPDVSATPFVTTAVDVQLIRILDLGDGNVRQAMRVSEKRLLLEPWRIIQDRGDEALTQAIGRMVRAAGIKGLVVPSAAHPGGTNLVIFPDNLTPAVDRLEIVNADDLPSPPRKP